MRRSVTSNLRGKNFYCLLATDYCLKEGAIKAQGFFVIADARTLLAFALAGIPGGAADNAAEARQLLAEGRADPGVGLVLITERLSREIRNEVDAIRGEGRPPLVLEIPDLQGPLPGGQSLLERLRALMGIPK
ncbi:MAG: V-type ATP synthase subunit F [Desulfobaccales bacterium]